MISHLNEEMKQMESKNSSNSRTNQNILNESRDFLSRPDWSIFIEE